MRVRSLLGEVRSPVPNSVVKKKKKKKQRKDMIEGNTYESNGVGEAGKAARL